jgi:hypothetical protein
MKRGVADEIAYDETKRQHIEIVVLYTKGVRCDVDKESRNNILITVRLRDWVGTGLAASVWTDRPRGDGGRAATLTTARLLSHHIQVARHGLLLPYVCTSTVPL